MIRRLRKHFLKVFIASVLFTTALIFFALRSEFVADKAHHYLLNYLEENLHSKIEMARPEIGWLKGSVYIKDVSIRPASDKEKREFVTAKGIRVSLFPWWNIFKREIGIRSVQVEAPTVYIRIENGRVANLPSLGFLKGQKGFIKFALREIRVSEGRIAMSYPERDADISLTGIQLKVKPDFDKGNYGFILTDAAVEVRARDLKQKVLALKGEFNISPGHLTVINSGILLPEGNLSAEGLYLDFITGKWNTKLAATLNLSILRRYVERPSLKGKADFSIAISGDGKGFDAKGEAKAETLELDGFKISETSVTLSTAGEWGLIKESAFNAELRSKMPVEMANRYLRGLPKTNGVASIHLKGSGRYPDVNVVGDMTSSRIEVAGVPVTRVSASVETDLKKINITDIAADLFGGSLSGALALGLKDTKGFKGRGHIENIALRELSNSLQTLIPKQSPLLMVAGGISGDIDISGGIEPEPVFEGKASFQAAGLNVFKGESSLVKFPRGVINAQLSHSAAATRLLLEIETPSSAISASGEMTDGRLSLGLDLKSSDLREFGLQIKGAGSLKGRISGTVSNPEAEGTLELRKASWGNYHTDTISGDIGFKDWVFSANGVRVVRGVSAILLKGELSLAEEMPWLDAVVELKRGRLEDIASLAGTGLSIEGEVSAAVRVEGRLRSLDGEIDLKGSNITIIDERIDTINVSGVLEKGRLLLKKGEVLRDGESIVVNGEIGREGYASLRIASSPLPIQALSYIKKAGIPLSGNLGLRGVVSGNISNPSFRGVASLSDIRYREMELGKGELTISASDMKLTASGTVFGSEIRGNILFKGNNPFHVSLSAEDLSLDPYIKGIAKVKGVTGVISASIDADGELSNPAETTATGHISKFQVVREPFFLKNRNGIDVELKGGKFMLNSFQLTGKGTELDASGWIGIDGEMGLLIAGNVDLYILQLFTGFIDKGAGIADLQFVISGKPPKVEGRVVVKDGVIGFKGADLVFTDISGNATLIGESLIVDTLTGRIGGGRFKGGGSLEITGLGLKKTDMSFDLRGVSLFYPKWLPSEVEGNLMLTGDYPSLLLSGEMNVVRARYSEKTDWLTFLPSFRQRLKEPRALKEGAGGLRLDIDFKADRNLIFDNNVGKGELKGDIRLKGDTSHMGIVGEIETLNGKVFYKEQEFKITSGIVEFPDPKKTEAIFDFTAEGKVRDYIVQILVQGNTNDLKVTMTSSPPLSELDIASLLSLGVTSKELQDKGGVVPAYGAVSIIAAGVEDKFKDYIGFDRFYLDSYYSKVTGTTEPKLTVGKDLSQDVWVLYSRGLSSAGEQDVQMEYKLYRNFSVLGGWSSFGESRTGDLGADMKFRFEFR